MTISFNYHRHDEPLSENVDHTWLRQRTIVPN
jgi:hypothetical protein